MPVPIPNACTNTKCAIPSANTGWPHSFDWPGVTVCKPLTDWSNTVSYTTVNFKTKKALREAIAAGEPVTVQREIMSGQLPTGTVYLEGPHYPAPHTWYAQVTVDATGVITKVKS